MVPIAVQMFIPRGIFACFCKNLTFVCCSIFVMYKSLFPVYTTLRKDGVIMSGQTKNNYKNTTSKDCKSSYSNDSKNSQCGCGSVEPLPESSRPRRDGPGGDDGE